MFTSTDLLENSSILYDYNSCSWSFDKFLNSSIVRNYSLASLTLQVCRDTQGFIGEKVLLFCSIIALRYCTLPAELAMVSTFNGRWRRCAVLSLLWKLRKFSIRVHSRETFFFLNLNHRRLPLLQWYIYTKYKISSRNSPRHSDSSCINFVSFAGIAKRKKKDNDEHRDRLIQIRESGDGRQVEVGFVNEVTDSRNQGGRKGVLGSRSSQMFDISCVLAFTILFIYAEARYILARCVPSMYTYALRDMEENSEQRSVRKRNKGMAERSVEDLKRPADGWRGKAELCTALPLRHNHLISNYNFVEYPFPR